MYSALDLFSGTRSATRFFAENGWNMEYVDILDGYDIRTYNPPCNFDFVWASPPCEEYSQGGPNNTWESKYSASRELWSHALRVIFAAKPRYWIIENVKGAQQIWGRSAYHYGPFFLWGWFPLIDAQIDWTKSVKGITSLGADNRNAAERAMIPEELSFAVYKSIKKGLENAYVPGSRDFKLERERYRQRLEANNEI